MNIYGMNKNAFDTHRTVDTLSVGNVSMVKDKLVSGAQFARSGVGIVCEKCKIQREKGVLHFFKMVLRFLHPMKHIVIFYSFLYKFL